MNARGDRVSQASLREQLLSFNKVFWIANTIEMFERLAYYGLRTVIPIYMVLALESSGPQFDHIQKGSIFAWWALVQSGVPILTGGFADRYGYKLTVGISIAIKIAGYLVMAFAVDLAAAATGGASLGVAGHPTTYGIFLTGALLLALGTAIFKPGIQGILAHQLDSSNESTGWAVFYQLVNLGAWFGPFLAGTLRLLSWKYVFVACAVIVSINYVLLLFFPSPLPRRAPTAPRGRWGPPRCCGRASSASGSRAWPRSSSCSRASGSCSTSSSTCFPTTSISGSTVAASSTCWQRRSSPGLRFERRQKHGAGTCPRST